MPTLSETVRGLSPAALRIFKQQLPERLKTMGELDRNTVMEQLRQLPELQEFPETQFPQQQQQPQEVPLWQKPLQWIRGVEQGAGALLASPFTPATQGTEGMSWWKREKAEYKEWEAPQTKLGFNYPKWLGGEEATLGVKGALELTPWFATSLATAGLGAVAGIGTKTGLTALTRAAALGQKGIRPIVAAERAITTAPFKVAGMALKPLRKFALKEIPDIARFTAPATEELERQMVTKDWMRKVAQTFGRVPVLKGAVEKIGGKAALVTEEVEDRTLRALLVGTRVQERLMSKGQVAMASLGRIHQNPVRLFGVEEATGIARNVTAKVKGTSLHISDIAEHPTKYILTTEQKAYIEQVHAVEDWVLDGLKQAGIEPNLLKFDEFSHWVHREVIGKNIDEALVKLRKGGGRIGTKAGWEKERFYEEAAKGVEAGILYEPSLERVTELYIQSAAKRIADQRIADSIASLGAKPLERAWEMAPAKMMAAKESAARYGGSIYTVKVLNRAIRGEKLTEATLSAVERKMPELGAAVRNAVGKREELKAILKQAKAISKESQAPYWKSKAERAGVMATAKTPTLGTEATIWHPAFQGKIYPKSVAGEIQRYWDDMGWGPLNKMANISGMMRTLVAAADFSAMFIQGLPGIALHPKAWAKGALASFRSFKNPKFYDEYLVKNLEPLMERANAGGYVGGFEYMEAMPVLQKTAGMVTGLAGKPQVGKQLIRQTYGRFEASFGSFGDVARNEMWKAFKKSARSPDELAEIARHLDRMTGVMSSKGLGIGKTQRSFEQAFLFFAPRYTRAGFALVGDMFKGGISGAEARKALGSMMAAGALFYTGICEAMGQEPNFDPTTGKFMTIEIKDPVTGMTRHFGLGGMMTSLMRFGADVTASTVGMGSNEPLDFVKLNRFDNPFIKFMFSKSAPLTGFTEGLLFGQNYFGEPFENPKDYAMFLAEQVTPIAFQQAMMEEGGFGPTSIAAEELGMRVFPRSDWEKRDIVRDDIAQRTYGMKWDEVGQQMGRLYQEQMLRDNPELQEATQLANESSSKMARGEGKVWDMWRKEGMAVEERFREAVTLASREFETVGDGTTFREKVDEAYAVRRAMYATREKDTQYAEINDFFNEPLDETSISKMHPKDLARREYYQMMYSPDMYDEFGNYNFAEGDRREAYFVTKYGQQALDYVEEYMGSKWQEPRALMALHGARETLKPYWNIETQIWQNYSPQLKVISDQIKILERTNPQEAKQMLFSHPQILMARKMIALFKKQLKARSPAIANALELYYRY